MTAGQKRDKCYSYIIYESRTPGKFEGRRLLVDVIDVDTGEIQEFYEGTNVGELAQRVLEVHKPLWEDDEVTTIPALRISSNGKENIPVQPNDIREFYKLMRSAVE